MAEDFSKNIKQAKIYADTLDAITKKTEAQNKAVGFLAQEMGIAYGGFIKQIEKSNEQKREEIKLMNQANASLKEQQKSAGNVALEMFGLEDALKKSASQQEIINKHLTSQFSDVKDIHGINEKLYDLQTKAEEGNKEAKKHFDELTKIKKNIFKEQEESDKKSQEAILMAIDNNELLQATLKAQGVDLSDNAAIMRVMNNLMEDGTDTMSALASLTEKDLGENYNKYVDNIAEANSQSNMLVDSQRESSRITQQANNQYREQIGLWEKIQGFAEQNAATLKKDIWSAMKDYDQAISDAGKDFGFIQDMTVDTSIQMANLNMEAARFGMSTKDTLQMMGSLGDELKTIDQKYLAESVSHFVAIQKATGISSEEVTTIAGEMMRAGKSAEQVESYMEGANKTAKMFGVNTKKILQGVARNIDKMRQMGFQGGEESLTRMAARAERLNMNMDEMFDVAKRARSIEGAMEMASELQLAGGSFANIDPMSLLAAARKGPEELQKILTQMGGDIGKFNKDTGELEFDAIDADRLQMVADATGQTVDSIQKGLQKTAKTNQKLDLLGLSGSIGDDEKNFLADLTSIDKDGTITMDPELNDLAKGAGISLDGVDSLDDLNQEQIQALMKAKKDDVASLEEQAMQNQSFSESMTALKDAFMNIFTVFEPFIKILTSFVQWLNGSTAGKWVVALGALAFVAIPKMVGAFGKFKEGATAITDSFKGMKGKKGIVGKIKGAFTGATPGKEEIKGAGSKDMAPKGGKEGGGLPSLAKGLAKMGGKNVLKGIGNLALAAPVLVIFAPAVIPLAALIAIGAGGALLEEGFRAIASGISKFGQYKGVLKGIGALALAAPVLLLFAPALIPLALMIPMGLGGPLIALFFESLAKGLGFLGSNLANVAKGSLALALAGASLIPFALAAQMMTDVDWMSVLAGVGVLALVILGLVGIGAMLMSPLGLFLAVGVLALIGVGAGLLIASVGLLAAGAAFQQLAEVDWNGISSMGGALMSTVPGLIAFSLASMMFLNPFALLGMLAMTATLGGLAMVMIPLGVGMMMAADGMERFADGLEKLQSAANSLDFERLEALKDLSMGMAIAGAGGGMLGDQIQKIAEALAALSSSGGGGGGGGTKKIQVDLKLNGRDLQSIIIDDTEIVS